MGVEKMECCGALTRVYSDAGRRKHEPDCLMNLSWKDLQTRLGVKTMPGSNPGEFPGSKMRLIRAHREAEELVRFLEQAKDEK